MLVEYIRQLLSSKKVTKWRIKFQKVYYLLFSSTNNSHPVGTHRYHRQSWSYLAAKLKISLLLNCEPGYLHPPGKAEHTIRSPWFDSITTCYYQFCARAIGSECGAWTFSTGRHKHQNSLGERKDTYIASIHEYPQMQERRLTRYHAFSNLK